MTTTFHPGAFLREELEARGIEAMFFPDQHGMNRQHFYDVINGTGSIDATMAEQLAAALGTSADLWLNLQRQYDAGSIARAHH